MRRGINFENWEENTEIVISLNSDERDSGKGMFQYGNYWNVLWEEVYKAFKEFSKREVTHDVSQSFAEIMKSKPHWNRLMVTLMWCSLCTEYCSLRILKINVTLVITTEDVSSIGSSIWESSGIPHFVNTCYINLGREQIQRGRES